MKRSLIVPGSLSSALQTMYFSLPGAVAHDFPFAAGRETRAAHAAQAAGLQLREEIWPISGSGVLPKRAVAWSAIVRVGQNRLPRSLVLLVREGFTRKRVANQAIGGSGTGARENAVIDRHCRRTIALTKARHFANRKIFRRSVLVTPFERSAKLIGSTQMAGHVATNAHVDLGRWRKTKMGIKAGYAVETIERNAGARRQCRQFVGGKVAELALDGMQLFVDQWQISGALRFQLCNSPAQEITFAPSVTGSLGGL